MASKRDPPTSADYGSYSGVHGANNDSDIHSPPRKTVKENHTYGWGDVRVVDRSVYTVNKKRRDPLPLNITISIKLMLANLCLPFHLKCGGCGTIIAKGVALKIIRVEQVGTYRNRQIRSFTLKCLCGRMIEVDEVPPKDEYKVATGGCELEESEYARWSNKPPQSNCFCDGVNIRWTD